MQNFSSTDMQINTGRQGVPMPAGIDLSPFRLYGRKALPQTAFLMVFRGRAPGRLSANSATRQFTAAGVFTGAFDGMESISGNDESFDIFLFFYLHSLLNNGIM